LAELLTGRTPPEAIEIEQTRIRAEQNSDQ
jgi:hypothetical protein